MSILSKIWKTLMCFFHCDKKNYNKNSRTMFAYKRRKLCANEPYRFAHTASVLANTYINCLMQEILTK